MSAHSFIIDSAWEKIFNGLIILIGIALVVGFCYVQTV